jgi:site-specific recombinase XerC
MPRELRVIAHDASTEERLRLKAQAASWRRKHCWSPNQLRHLRGTEIRKRFGLEASQTVLGHSHADTTEIYAERDFVLAESVMSQMG